MSSKISLFFSTERRSFNTNFVGIGILSIPSIPAVLRNEKILVACEFIKISIHVQLNRMKTCAIHWFRKGLRLHDNPALQAACKVAVDVKPVFILDPWFANNANVGVNRWRFLLQTLQNLDENLKKINSR